MQVLSTRQRGVAIVGNSQVLGVSIRYPGRYYTDDFYVYFYGGGGVGAIGLAEVYPLSEGGGIRKDYNAVRWIQLHSPTQDSVWY